MAKQNQNQRQRLIDQSMRKATESLPSRFIIASRTEVKRWKAFVILMFVAGFAAALVWSSYNRWYIGSEAKKDTKDSSISDEKNLAAYWNFDEDKNGIVHDKSGNKNDGVVNGATECSGKQRKALEFDGTNAFVKVSNSPSLNITDKITLEAWIYPQGDKNGPAYLDGIITKGGVFDKDASYQLYFNPRSSRVVGVMRWGREKKDFEVISKDVEQNKWTHVALAFEEKSGLKLYVNGNLVRSKKFPDGKKIQSSSLDVNIGGAYPDKYQTRYFYGKIDEVRIYKRALTAYEIKKHSGFDSLPVKNLIYAPYGQKADYKYSDLSDSLLKEIKDSPYDSVSIDLAGVRDDNVPSFEGLSSNLEAAKKSGKLIWPRIYFNRVVGCCEAPLELQQLKDAKKCGNKEELEKIYKMPSPSTGYVCADNGYYCHNACFDKKSLSSYSKNVADKGKNIDLWDKAGALSDFYKLLETSLRLAKENGSPGIFIDHEIYNNYRMYRISTIAKDNGMKPNDVIAKLESIGHEIADRVNSVYPEAVLLFASADFSIEQGDGNMRSTNYIVKGILEQAKKKKYSLKVVDGGEKSVWYLHSGVDASGVKDKDGNLAGLAQRLDEQKDKMEAYLKKYPNNFLLGGTHGLYLNWKETEGNWNDWLTDIEKKNKLEAKTANDLLPLLKYLSDKREYVWIFSGAPSSKGYDEFSYSQDPGYISKFRDILRPIFCGNSVCDENRGENKKSCAVDCGENDKEGTDVVSDDM